MLVGQIQNLAPQLTPASLVAASNLIGSLSPVAPRQSTAMQSAMNNEDPLVPQQLVQRMELEAADSSGGAAVGGEGEVAVAVA